MFLISYGFEDGDGNQARARVAVPFSVGFDGAKTFAAACYSRMSTLSGCAIVDYTITYKYEVQSPPALPGSNANEYMCCVVLLQNGDVAIQSIPGPLVDLFELDANNDSLYVIKMNDQRIADFSTALIGTQSWYGVEISGIIVAGLAY